MPGDRRDAASFHKRRRRRRRVIERPLRHAQLAHGSSETLHDDMCIRCIFRSKVLHESLPQSAVCDSRACSTSPPQSAAASEHESAPCQLLNASSSSSSSNSSSSSSVRTRKCTMPDHAAAEAGGARCRMRGCATPLLLQRHCRIGQQWTRRPCMRHLVRRQAC